MTTAPDFEALYWQRVKETGELRSLLKAVCSLIAKEGCDCLCDHDSESHDDECERCLACRLSTVLDGEGGTE